MPTVSEAQKRFFELCKHTPQHARGECPARRVVTEFLKADKRVKKTTAQARRAAVAERAYTSG